MRSATLIILIAFHCRLMAKAHSAERDFTKGVWIYFGSQTGTSERFAEEIAKDCSKRGITAEVVDLGDFDPEQFVQHKTIILVVATWGEGEPTDSAIEFFRWLEKPVNAEADRLGSIKFAVMGLGNRQYDNYNTMGKSVETHMKRRGAEMIYRRGEGDDDDDIERDFQEWKEGGFWPALKAAVAVETTAAYTKPRKTQVEVALKGNLNDAKAGSDPAVPADSNIIHGDREAQQLAVDVTMQEQLATAEQKLAGLNTTEKQEKATDASMQKQFAAAEKQPLTKQEELRSETGTRPTESSASFAWAFKKTWSTIENVAAYYLPKKSPSSTSQLFTQSSLKAISIPVVQVISFFVGSGITFAVLSSRCSAQNIS